MPILCCVLIALLRCTLKAIQREKKAAHAAAAQAKETAAAESKGEDGKKRRRQDNEYGVSRGVDFREVKNVVNFDFPATAKSYVHRVGRCVALCSFSSLFAVGAAVCRVAALLKLSGCFVGVRLRFVCLCASALLAFLCACVWIGGCECGWWVHSLVR